MEQGLQQQHAQIFSKKLVLKKILDIPVFHDDQHGTAIITTAALINAVDIAKKNLKKIKIVINGAGAAAMACAKLFRSTGIPKNNIKMLDTKGVINKNRKDINSWKKEFAVETIDKNLDDAMKMQMYFQVCPPQVLLKRVW